MTRKLLRLGASGCITSRKRDVLVQANSDLERETGGRSLTVACDVRRIKNVELLHAGRTSPSGRWTAHGCREPGSSR